MNATNIHKTHFLKTIARRFICPVICRQKDPAHN